jgi:nucleotide-binding universal stress UspA family protein
MKVLLTTDGSSGASAAAHTARRILRTEERQIDLLCVAPEYLPRMTGWDESRAAKLYKHRILAEAERIVSAAEVALVSEGVEVSRRTEVGSAQGVIVRASAGYDLTVLGAQGRGARSDAGLGPVANHVLHHAAGSVLIGRELHSDTGFRVLVAVDGSTPLTIQVMMTSLLDLESADVTLMHVVETPWMHLGLRFSDRVHDQIEPEIEWDKKVRLQAQRVIDGAREQLRPHHRASDRLS